MPRGHPLFLKLEKGGKKNEGAAKKRRAIFRAADARRPTVRLVRCGRALRADSSPPVTIYPLHKSFVFKAALKLNIRKRTRGSMFPF